MGTTTFPSAFLISKLKAMYEFVGSRSTGVYMADNRQPSDDSKEMLFLALIGGLDAQACATGSVSGRSVKPRKYPRPMMLMSVAPFEHWSSWIHASSSPFGTEDPDMEPLKTASTMAAKKMEYRTRPQRVRFLNRSPIMPMLPHYR